MSDLLDSIERDIERLVRGHPSRAKATVVILTNRGLQAVVLYRISHALLLHHVPLLPLILTRLAQFLFAIDISPRAELGPGIVIVHGFGVVIGGEVKIESDCCIFHGVTLGDRGSEWVNSVDRPDGHPVVETGVMIGAGAKILGPVRIGRHSVIGANAVVSKDVPPCSVAAGVPARIVGRPKTSECEESSIEALST